jgi:hypothetical protein
VRLAFYELRRAHLLEGTAFDGPDRDPLSPRAALKRAAQLGAAALATPLVVSVAVPPQRECLSARPVVSHRRIFVASQKTGELSTACHRLRYAAAVQQMRGFVVRLRRVARTESMRFAARVPDRVLPHVNAVRSPIQQPSSQPVASWKLPAVQVCLQHRSRPRSAVDRKSHFADATPQGCQPVIPSLNELVAKDPNFRLIRQSNARASR